MLTIEPPYYQIRGVIVFRDHENPDQFYCLPGMPKIARRPAGLAFRLFKYRRDLTDNPALDPTRARGGGLAQFDVEIPPPPMAVLEGELASLASRPQARLSPVVFRSSNVHAIVAHGSGDRLVEDLVETHLAPLTSPHASTFALAVSAEGATLIDQAARGGDLPVGVAYEMQFLALTPSLHARASMDHARAYDRFAASVGFTYYVSAKLDVDLAWLEEHGHLKVEITSFTDAADSQRQRDMVMQLVKLRVQQDFFRSGLPPEPQDGIAGPLGQLLGQVLGNSEISSASALFVLKARLEVVREDKTFELTFHGRTAVDLTHVSCGLLSTMVPDGEALAIREIDLDDPFFSSLDVSIASAIDFDELADLREALLHLTFGSHRASFSISRTALGPFRFEVPLTDPRHDEFTWEVEYVFDALRGSGEPRVVAGPFRSRRRALTLDPLAHFRYRRVRVLLGPLDPQLVPRVHVQLRIRDDDGELVRTELRLDAASPEQVWRAHLPMAFSTLRVFARTDWEDPQGAVHAGEEEEVTGSTYVALGPYREIMAVTLQPGVDWSRTLQVLVELRYRDGDHVVHAQRTFDKSQGHASQQVEIPLLDRTKRGYEWRQLLVRADGTADQQDWKAADRLLLLVGAEAPRAGDVRIVWVGPPGEALGLRVDFVATRADGSEEALSTFLRTGQDVEKVLALPLGPDGRLAYRYTVSRITAAGQETTRLGEGQNNLLVVQA